MCMDLERLKQSIPCWSIAETQLEPSPGCCLAGISRFVPPGIRNPILPFLCQRLYVNVRKNLFYCHGCGRCGDLIRFVQILLDLPFRQSLAHLKGESGIRCQSDCRPLSAEVIHLNNLSDQVLQR